MPLRRSASFSFFEELFRTDFFLLYFYAPCYPCCLFIAVAFSQVPYNEAGLTALIFTSEGDMRQAVNNLQSTFSGFNFVGPDEVFKVCDQPHPVTVEALIKSCAKGEIDNAMVKLDQLWSHGYAAVDIVATLFRVTKNMSSLAEYIKLEFIRVCPSPFFLCFPFFGAEDPNAREKSFELCFAGDWFDTYEDSRRLLDAGPVGRVVSTTLSSDHQALNIGI